MSDNKAPVRVWLRADSVLHGMPTIPARNRIMPNDTEWISAAALRELVERWRSYNAAGNNSEFWDGVRANARVCANELEQLLEADR